MALTEDVPVLEDADLAFPPHEDDDLVLEAWMLVDDVLDEDAEVEEREVLAA